MLLGKPTAKVEQHRHGGLSVFGIGADLEQRIWRSVVRQLIVHGFLRADPERYGALVLTARSRGLLRGETPVRFREDTVRAVGTPRPTEKKPTIVDTNVVDNNPELWEALRACRRELATEHGVPPYVIFHDKTLREMLVHRPGNESEMLAINGVGQTKLERYGAQFLSVLRDGGAEIS